MLASNLITSGLRRGRSVAAVALLLVLVPTAVLGYQRSANAQDDQLGSGVTSSVIAQTAEVAASLDIDVDDNPLLYGAIAQLEQWALGAEAEVARQQAIVVLADNAGARLRDQLEDDRRQLDYVSNAARSENLTATVVEMRDLRPVLKDKVRRGTEALHDADALAAQEAEKLGADLDSLIEIWSERQRILSDLAGEIGRRGDTGRSSGRSADETLAGRVLAQMAAARQMQSLSLRPDLWMSDPEGVRVSLPGGSLDDSVTAEALERGQAMSIDGVSDQPEMRWPVIGAVTSGFGMRMHPIYRRNIMHTGLDIDAPWGDAVLAVADGVVTEAHWMGGYGNAVVVDHGDGITSLYSHMSELRVEVGDGIASGDQVGLVGATGTATGAHLHFEVRLDGEATDPLGYLP